MQRTSALSAAQPLSERIERKRHRDSWKPWHRPQPNLPTSRAGAFDVRIALGSELLDAGVERVHPVGAIGAAAPRNSNGKDANSTNRDHTPHNLGS